MFKYKLHEQKSVLCLQAWICICVVSRNIFLTNQSLSEIL